MRHGSLFSGIGGFDLAADYIGWNNVLHCEINQFCKKVLDFYWPKAISYSDIKQVDFKKHEGTIDIISGGFPCQPYSLAGKRKGTEDERHLWPEMLRAIREIQPRWVVGENVFGLINWSRGMVLKQIKADLENEGFEILSATIIPACAKDAPHRRDRLWIVAYSNKNANIRRAGKNERSCEEERIQEWDKIQQPIKPISLHEAFANTDKNLRCEGKSKEQILRQRNLYEQSERGFEGFRGRRHISTPSLCGNDDGVSFKLDGITFSKWRTETLGAYGNAIVPNVAYEIFKAIEKFEDLIK